MPDSTTIIFFVALIGAWGLIIGLQIITSRRRQREKETVEIGDEVVTTGGIIGKVKRLEPEVMVLEIGKNTELRVERDAFKGYWQKPTSRKKRR